MSSESMIRIVAKEINHYFNKARFEECFDNKSYLNPQVRHHPIKSKSTVTFGVTPDRDIKHYFSHPEMRIFLTQFENVKDEHQRQEILKKVLEGYIKKYQLKDGVIKPPGFKRNHAWVKDKEIPCYRDPQFSYLKYRREKKEKLNQKEKKKISPPVQNYPLFTNTPNPEITRGQAERLVNIATKMLCASEQVLHRKSRTTPPTGSKRLYYQPTEAIEKQPKKPVDHSKISQLKRESLNTNESNTALAKSSTRQNSNSIRSNSKLNSAKLHHSEKKSQRKIALSNYEQQQYSSSSRDLQEDLLPRWLVKELEKCLDEKKRIQNKHKRETAYSKDSRSPPKLNNPNDVTELFSDSDEISELSECNDEEKMVKINETSKNTVNEQAQFVRHFPPHTQLRRSRDNSRPSHQKRTMASSSAKRSKHRVMTPVEEEKHNKKSPHFKASVGLQYGAGVQTDRELLAKYDQSEQYVSEESGTAEYEVIIETGDRLGASSRAAIYLSLIGSLGRSKQIHLVDSHTHKVPFRKGRSDLFTINYPYVGTLEKIQIGHDDMDPACNWFLESVTISDRKSLQRHFFICRKWLGVGLNSKETKVILSPTSTVDIPARETLPRLDDTIQDSEQDLAPKSHITLEETVVCKHSARSEDGATFDSMEGGVSERSSHQDSPAEEGRLQSTAGVCEYRLVSPEDCHNYYSVYLDEDSYSNESDSFEALPNDNTELEECTSTGGATNIHKNNSNRGMQSGKVAAVFREEGSHEPSKLSLHDRSLQSVETVEQDKEYEDELCAIRSDRADSNSSVVSVTDEEDRNSLDSLSHHVTIKDPTNDAFDLQNAYTNPINFSPEEEREVEEMIQKRISDSFLSSCSIHEAIKLNQYFTVLRLVQTFKKNISSEDERGFLPIHTACEAGFSEILELLFHFDANFDVETPTGYLPVHLAALNGQLEALQTLHRLGIHLDVPDQQGNKLIHLGALGGHFEVVKWLVEEIKMPIVKNLNQETPEDVAEIFGFPSVADYLRSTPQAAGIKNTLQPLKIDKTESEKLLKVLLYNSLFDEAIQ